MIKAEEIDGYRGCDDLDSILQFIEKGDEKKGKSGSKRSSNTGRNRMESPATSASVATKQRSKQNQSEKNNGSVDSNQKAVISNKKSANKRSQTPGENRIGVNNSEKQLQLEIQTSPSPPENKDEDKNEIVPSKHSNLRNDIEYIADNEMNNKNDNLRSDMPDAEKHTEEKLNLYEEEEDEDDTPFVMIRRVNNHSNSNKAGKGKAYNENSPATHGKPINLNGNNTNRNSKYGNKNNQSSSGRNTLKRKSKSGNNEGEGYIHKDANSSISVSKQDNQTASVVPAIKSKAASNNLNYSSDHQIIYDTNAFNNSVKSEQSNSNDNTMSEVELKTLKTNEGEVNESYLQDLPISFSSVVQAKKGNKAPRGKSKSKGGNGFNHKQFIDAALNSPTPSKRHNDSKQQDNGPSDSNKSKISNTFIAEAMLPEPVLEYSRTHSSHSPPPTANESDDLKHVKTQQDSSCNFNNQTEDVVNHLQLENNGQSGRNVSRALCTPLIKDSTADTIFNDSDIKDNLIATNESLDPEYDNPEYECGDSVGIHSPQEFIHNPNQDSMKITQCHNKIPKSYCSALVSSPDDKDINEVVSNVSIMNVKNTILNDNDIGMISNKVDSDSRIEMDEFGASDPGNINTNPICKTGLSTSTSPISSRSSSFTWYEEEDDLVEGTFNYNTILNFIKSGKLF